MSFWGQGEGMLVIRMAVQALVALSLGIFVAPLTADAADSAKIPRIGVLREGSPPDPNVEGFRQGLRDLGYVEGQTILIEYRWAAGKPERLPDLAAELVRLKVDVIVTGGGTATQAARNASSALPIVTAAAGDPKAGFAASLARPGGNVTGLSVINVELSAKKLQLLTEAIPRASRVTMLGNPTNPSYAALRHETEVAARSLKVQLRSLEARSPGELESAFRAMTKERASAFILAPDEMLFGLRLRIVGLAKENRLPGVYENRGYVDAGGLMSYGPSFPAIFRRAATYVDKILKGAKPADLPVEQPTRFELIVNLKTAKALGLTIPQSILVRAEQVIQ